MALSWDELKAYVNEQGRTRPQLERVARSIGVNPNVTGNLLLHNLNRRIESRIQSEGGDAISGFTPPPARNNNGNQGRRQGQRQGNQPPPRRRPTRRNGNNRGQRNQDGGNMLNQHVLLVVTQLRSNDEDEATLNDVADAYGVDENLNFYRRKLALLQILTEDRDGRAPQEAHDAIEAWEARQPVPPTPPARRGRQPRNPQNPPNGGNLMSSNRWLWLLALAAIAALIYFVFIAPEKDWWPNNDDSNSTPTSPDSTPTATATSPAGNDETPAPTGTANPSETPSPTTTPATRGNTLKPGAAPVWNASAFRHPEQFVQCQKTFDPVADQVDWLTCEPGVLLDNTATFTRPEVDMVHQSNCPEGGFWYGSMHHGVVNVKGVGIELPDRGEGTNHLLLIRCALSDGKRDVDLNTTMDIGSFVIGHAIWSPIPPNHPDGSAYVSQEWFGEQLVTSHTTGGTNCGSDGCSKVYVVFYDVNSQSLQTFLVTDIAGETGDADSDGIVDYASAKWELVSSNR